MERVEEELIEEVAPHPDRQSVAPAPGVAGAERQRVLGHAHHGVGPAGVDRMVGADMGPQHASHHLDRGSQVLLTRRPLADDVALENVDDGLVERDPPARELPVLLDHAHHESLESALDVAGLRRTSAAS